MLRRSLRAKNLLSARRLYGIAVPPAPDPSVWTLTNGLLGTPRQGRREAIFKFELEA